jgi:hypothetical protein
MVGIEVMVEDRLLFDIDPIKEKPKEAILNT